ncbi:formate dehydrogenase accessory sulfurtransferase FdhD [Acetobacter conturbans]|uniref:Sulfur carrier protein FdhD n=1 Tax=Acetobacter conturbans TaxID=1737472 RepID=A0ABX0K0U7_9PROT|nr:formate dehydrogenase accessory sulfurtransferase FdhD [Acetobacter conturbans]NHN87933.1 formate dehydrogenase accessory sulfurtransferase FdhD [Acetobacter conturbans]
MSEETIFPVAQTYDTERVNWVNDSLEAPVERASDSLVVADEVPLSLFYDGLDYAVMMVTPHDVDDFVTGFSFTEGIVSSPSDLRQITVTATSDGLRADILTGPEALRTVLSRSRRPIAGRTGCGICGTDAASIMERGEGRVRGREPEPHSIRHALENLRDHQTLNKGVGMLHAAAWCRPDGHILHVREDVGRHNALDKLIGLGLRKQVDFTEGFCLLTCRCSYEMAAKAITAGMSAVIALSSPTALAIRIAREAGLVLVAPARSTGLHVVSPAPVTEV